MNPRYSIGDLIVIVAVPKIGIIYDVWQIGNKKKYNYYKVYWTYKDGFHESVSIGEMVIDNWFSYANLNSKERQNQLFRTPPPCEKHQKPK
jgi:hypothetical protein